MPLTLNGTTGIVTGNLADASVTTAKIADSAVVTADIANGAVTAAKLSGGQTGSAPVYGCRAWVNFDGTRDTTGAASTANTNRFIRSSGNVASVLRNSVGDYTITFTTAMSDAGYSVIGGTSPAIGVSATAGSWWFGVATNASGNPLNKTTSAVQVKNAYLTSGTISDAPELYLTVFGN